MWVRICHYMHVKWTVFVSHFLEVEEDVAKEYQACKYEKQQVGPWSCPTSTEYIYITHRIGPRNGSFLCYAACHARRLKVWRERKPTWFSTYCRMLLRPRRIATHRTLHSRFFFAAIFRQGRLGGRNKEPSFYFFPLLSSPRSSMLVVVAQSRPKGRK